MSSSASQPDHTAAVYPSGRNSTGSFDLSHDSVLTEGITTDRPETSGLSNACGADAADIPGNLGVSNTASQPDHIDFSFLSNIIHSPRQRGEHEADMPNNGMSNACVNATAERNGKKAESTADMPETSGMSHSCVEDRADTRKNYAVSIAPVLKQRDSHSNRPGNAPDARHQTSEPSSSSSHSINTYIHPDERYPPFRKRVRDDERQAIRNTNARKEQCFNHKRAFQGPANKKVTKKARLAHLNREAIESFERLKASRRSSVNTNVTQSPSQLPISASILQF